MNIMICGASGLVGSALVNKLKHHHELTLVGRHPEQMKKQFSDISQHISWDIYLRCLLLSSNLSLTLLVKILVIKDGQQSKKADCK